VSGLGSDEKDDCKMVCPPGTTGNPLDGECQICGANTFKGDEGDGACVACPSNSESAAGSAACVCKAGYWRDSNGCVACAQGTFKTAAGDEQCKSCGVGTYNPNTASTELASCLPCPSHSSSPAGSDSVGNCVCDSGYTQGASTDAACVACDRGTYKADPGDGACTSCSAGKILDKQGATSNECEACPLHTFAADDGSECTSCPAHAQTLAPQSQTIADCKCNAGYFGTDGTSCTACPPGKYKAKHGSDECVECAQLAEGLTTTGGAGKTDASSCVCAKGATGSPGVCLLCSVACKILKDTIQNSP